MIGRGSEVGPVAQPVALSPALWAVRSQTASPRATDPLSDFLGARCDGLQRANRRRIKCGPARALKEIEFALLVQVAVRVKDRRRQQSRQPGNYFTLKAVWIS